MIGKQIRNRRQAAGVTQKQFAIMSGFSQSYISELETGKKPNPPIETLEKVAEALLTSVAHLIKESEQTT